MVKSVDTSLERIYRRLGWRIILAYQLLIWASSIVLGGSGIAVFARITELSLDDTLALLALFVLGQLLGAVVASLGVLRAVRPLVVWLESPREPTGAESVWRIGLRLPQITMRWNTLVALCFCSRR